MKTLAQQTFESLAQLDGVIIGVESGMVTDDQLVEFLTTCSEDDFAVLQAELNQDVVKNLGEVTGTGDLKDMLDTKKTKAALESFRSKVITPGALKATAVQKLTAESRRILASAVLKAGRIREAKWLSKSGKEKMVQAWAGK